MYPMSHKDLACYCEDEIDKVKNKVGYDYEYGISWPDFWEYHTNEWHPIVEAYWESLTLEEQVTIVRKKLREVEENYLRSKEWYEEWLKENESNLSGSL